MLVIRCTQKLLVRLKQTDDLRPVESTTRLGDWYGNVLQLGHRQHLLFISERSRLSVVIVEEPPDNMRVPRTEWSPTRRLTRFDFVARDAANRDLGRRGEEFVLEFERRRLHDAGQRQLVKRIEWTAHVRGDGAGYDRRRQRRSRDRTSERRAGTRADR
jgi:hypothetical protein